MPTTVWARHKKRYTCTAFSPFEQAQHIGAADGFANSLCVSHVVLLPFDVGLHVSWRHQSHAMTEGPKFARPMVRRSASLDAD
jgi:hypothetical protein